MAPTLLDRVADVLLRDGAVWSVEDLSPHFRRVELVVPSRPKWAPGQKVQFRTRNLDFRTYTPYAWHDNSVSFLIVRHGDGPARRWADALEPGSTTTMFGPKGAVSFDGLRAPIFVGDETSSLSAAWRSAGDDAPTADLFEVTDADESTGVLAKLGLPGAAVIEREASDAHLSVLTTRVVDLVAAHRDAPLVLTGKAQTIAAVRAALSAAQLKPMTRVKTHWDPRRSGLD